MKSSYRTSFKAILSSLSVKRREEASCSLLSFLSERLPKEGLVLSFASTPLEIDLSLLNNELLLSRRLVLPKIEGDELVLYYVQDNACLRSSLYSILEPDPVSCIKVPCDLIAIALVPGLCFSHANYRIGYGKGYFDRLLPKLSQAQNYGLGFIEQKVESFPIEPHDVQLDEVLLF